MTTEIDPRLKKNLDALKTVPERDPRAAARGRARFLSQAAALREAVSERERRRLNGWILFPRKERRWMNALISLVLAGVLLIGGGATAVSAAQDDLPTDPLYGVKTLTEDVRLWANTDPQAEVELLMEMAQTRTREMAALTARGDDVPARVTERLNRHFQEALQTAAGMDDAAMQAALLRIRAQLQAQEQEMVMLQAQYGEAPLTTQTREMLRDRIRLVDDGLADPEGFRNTYRHENCYGLTETPTPVSTEELPQATPTAGGNGYGPGNPTCTPVPNNYQDPGPNATPGGNGPGSGGNGR